MKRKCTWLDIALPLLVCPLWSGPRTRHGCVPERGWRSHLRRGPGHYGRGLRTERPGGWPVADPGSRRPGVGDSRRNDDPGPQHCRRVRVGGLLAGSRIRRLFEAALETIFRQVVWTLRQFNLGDDVKLSAGAWLSTSTCRRRRPSSPRRPFGGPAFGAGIESLSGHSITLSPGTASTGTGAAGIPPVPCIALRSTRKTITTSRMRST